jgi:outer membrane protein OmpA-like peptidoglycan-associated protein
MLSTNKIMQKFIISSLMVIFACTTVLAQTTPPIWWFGASGAANFNFYSGTTQQLNNSLIVPTPFHKGNGVRPYVSVLTEYRPSKIWGLMLNVGYDGLGAKYDNEVAPCDCPASLKSDLNYISVEPSFRLGFKSNDLYFFAGPSFAINIDRDFAYTQLKQPNTDADMSSVYKTMVSGQVGVGYDFMLSPVTSETKYSLSPFVSYHPYFGQDPRSIESLSITTLRVGVAIKFGKVHKVPAAEPQAAIPVIPVVRPPVDVTFAVTQPDYVPLKRLVSETFPLLNSVFFEEGSTEIPSRYVMLTHDQASGFKEVQLQDQQAESMKGRSAGQLNVYHNVLNIIGERMLENPGANITLEGSSPKGPEDAKELAKSVKAYLVSSFGIDGSRIAVEGSLRARPSSEHPGGTKDLRLLQAEDCRVDIESKSPELLIEVGGGMIKPVQILETQLDPLDSHVIFHIDSAEQKLKSWSVNITNANGVTQNYGPFTSDEESIPGAAILGDSPGGDYKTVMVGQTNDGKTITKESTIHLVRQDVTVEKGYRYSIIFDFDKAKSIEEYAKFLTDIVSPLIINGSTVVIHGHTDIIGFDGYNQKLSERRAEDTQKILEHAIANSGRSNIKFKTIGFGSNVNRSQFNNNLPEERFYNRSVVIDIVPAK